MNCFQRDIVRRNITSLWLSIVKKMENFTL